jgi:membrane associated rhomboid family serine protease
MSQSWVDLYTHLFHADEYSALSLYKVVPRLGASGAVFGVLGARFYTSLFSRRTHSPLSQTEILYLVAILAYEASLTPIQLQNLWDLFVMGDNIDHAGHLLGFFTGFLLAFIIQRWQVYKGKRRYNWGAVGGRHLGTQLNNVFLQRISSKLHDLFVEAKHKIKSKLVTVPKFETR